MPQALLQQLDKSYKQRLSAAVSSRISFGADKITSTNGASIGAAPIRDGSRAHQHRGGKADTEGGSVGSGCNSQPVYQQYSCSPEERWLTGTSDESQTAKYLCTEGPLQNGRGSHDQRAAEEGRLNGLHRFKGCLPLSSNCTSSLQIPAIQMERSDSQISVPSLWPQQCPTYVHKGIEASHSNSEAERNKVYCFHRRHLLDGTVSTGIARADPGSDPAPSAPRIQDKLGKIGADSQSGDNLPVFLDQLEVDDALPPRGETAGHHIIRWQDGSIPTVSVGMYSGQDNRQDDGGISSDCNCTLALQQAKNRAFRHCTAH